MFFIREDITRAFKNGIFPYIDGFKVEKESDENEEIDTTNKADIESEESASILPITLAQLKAGNNSEKLKNEIRQLLYSLYRSKKLTKQLYKSLVDII